MPWRSARRILDLGSRWRWGLVFTPRPLYPCTHWIEGWMGQTHDVEAMAKRKIPVPTRNRTPIFQPIAVHFTELSTPWNFKACKLNLSIDISATYILSFLLMTLYLFSSCSALQKGWNWTKYVTSTFKKFSKIIAEHWTKFRLEFQTAHYINLLVSCYFQCNKRFWHVHESHSRQQSNHQSVVVCILFYRYDQWASEPLIAAIGIKGKP